MIPTIAEQGNSVVSETNALVTTHVRNDSPQNPLDFAPPQIGLLWENGGCRAASFLDKDKNKAPTLFLGPGQIKEVSFICPRFPFLRDRKIEGDPDNDNVRSVSTSGRPAISLGLWVKNQDEPLRTPLLASDELEWVDEPITHHNPPLSLSLRMSVGAAPSLAGGAYRSFVAVDVSGMMRRLELSLAWHAYQDAPVALTNEGARTIALTPGLGVSFSLAKRANSGARRLELGARL